MTDTHTEKGENMNYENEIRAFVVTNFLYGDAAPLQDNTSFLAGGILDSTGILELVTFLESTYNISIETQELLPSNLDSINNVVQFLSRKLASSPSCSTTPLMGNDADGSSFAYAPQP